MTAESADAHLSVTRDVDTIPKIFRWGSGQFTDVKSSQPGEKSPIVVGTWSVDDLDNGSTVVVAEVDEAKFITRGESVWKDAHTGETLQANAGSMVWMPKGSRSILVSCKNLVAFYVEATQRPVSRVSPSPQEVQVSIVKILQPLRDDYEAKNQLSKASFEKAKAVLAGGNTRSVLFYEPFPMILSSGRGCYVTSEDGHEYIDFVSEYSACMLGHSHPEISKAVESTMARGITLGGASKEESTLASLLAERIPSMEKLRFCNSGTEANTMALIVAQHFTKRTKILAFESGYHGGFLGFGRTRLPTTLPFEFVLGRYNDVDAIPSMADDSFAAIIVEPMQSVGGMIPATRDFLQGLRDLATRTGAVLIFDEVVTSRLHYNGLQGYHQVIPDMTTIGKFWGGGFSFGAFGGRANIMETLDPGSGNLGHSGTFNNNAFSMTAGAVACRLITREAIDGVNALGDRLRGGINEAGKLTEDEPLITATGFGSTIGLHFGGPSPGKLQDAFFFFMLSRGIYVARRGFMALNLMHQQTHVTEALDAVREFVEELIKVSVPE